MEHDGTRYRLREFGDGRVLERLRAGAGWEPQFCFTLTPRRLAEFGAECLRLQTSPESSFTRKAVCSLPTTDGRVTLSGDRLIRTRLGRRIEEVVADPRQYRAVLRGQVGLELDPGASVERLIALRPL